MRKSLQIVSLFSGSGGLDLGFKHPGFSSILGIDIAPQQSKTLIATHSIHPTRGEVTTVPSTSSMPAPATANAPYKSTPTLPIARTAALVAGRRRGPIRSGFLETE